MTAQPHLSSAFHEACLSSANYPLNLDLHGIEYTEEVLSTYKRKLDLLEAELCLRNEDEVEVPIRDFRVGNASIDPINRRIHSSTKLLAWLGMNAHQSGTNGISTPSVTFEQRDPKCRFIYIFAEHARDQLRITREMLALILSYHHVMPAYLDFMFVFGAQCETREMSFSGFRSQVTLQGRGITSFPSEICRSGRQFQLCYNVKGVTLKREDDDGLKLDQWSIRQAAIHHQFDVVEGTMLWLVTKGRLDIERRFKQMTESTRISQCNSFENSQDCFRSSLAIHLMMCHWCTEDWRWYINWMEKVFHEVTDVIVYGPYGDIYAHSNYQPYHIQEVQRLKDRTNQAIAHIQSNIDIMTALEHFYDNLKEYEGFPQQLLNDCAKDLKSFQLHIREIISGFKIQLSRLALLEVSLHERKDLISQHLEIQSIQRAEDLNVSLKKDGTRMLVITLVTVVFLPATFVSTFLSTDILKYENSVSISGAQEIFSPIALQRWLELTIPLTIVTLGTAWIISKQAQNTSDHIAQATGQQGQLPRQGNLLGTTLTGIRGRFSPRRALTLPQHHQHP